MVSGRFGSQSHSMANPMPTAAPIKTRSRIIANIILIAVSVVPWKHLLAVPVLLLLYFYGLDQVGLLGPDEPRYASVGREMAESGDWITPHLWTKPWFEKPALLYWLTGAGYKAGWGDALAPRLPVALVCAAFLFFYFHQLRREFGERAALYSAMMLSTTAGWLAFGQVGVTDMPLAATFSASMLCCLAWVRSGGRRGLTIGGVLLGLAVLAKGLVPLVLAIPLAFVGRKRWRDLLLFAFTTAAVAAPWYVLCWLRNGQTFIDEFFWKHHFARFTEGSLQHVQPMWFYIPIFAGLLLPWTPALLSLIGRRPDDSRENLLLGWLLFGFLFFSLSTNKLPGYLLPLLPAACALAGRQLATETGKRWILPSCALLVGVFPIAATNIPSYIVPASTKPDFSFPAWPIVAAIALAIICALAERQQRRTLAISLVLSGMVGAIFYTKLTTYPTLDLSTSRPLWKPELTGNACVEDLHRSYRYGLNFYAGYELPVCTSADTRTHITK